jgi:hypothetical protein
MYEGELFLCEVCLEQDGVPKDMTLSYTVTKGKNSFA